MNRWNGPLGLSPHTGASIEGFIQSQARSAHDPWNASAGPERLSLRQFEGIIQTEALSSPPFEGRVVVARRRTRLSLLRVLLMLGDNQNEHQLDFFIFGI